MHCNGKCYLVKQLKEQSKQDQLPASKKDKIDVQLFCNNISYTDLNSPEATPPSFSSFDILKTFSFTNLVFHPPLGAFSFFSHQLSAISFQKNILLELVF